MLIQLLYTDAIAIETPVGVLLQSNSRTEEFKG